MRQERVSIEFMNRESVSSAYDAITWPRSSFQA